MQTVTIVTPVFNDWESFIVLLKQLDKGSQQNGLRYCVIAIDDGSANQPNQTHLTSAITESKSIHRLHIVQLVTNMGHQRAIALGLVEAMHCYPDQNVVVMDSDGEDRPEDVSALCSASTAGQVVVAERAKRSEGIGFRFFYRIYKTLFRLLTGQAISFGNFSMIPATLLPRICKTPAFWNHYSAALVQSRLPIIRSPIDRGSRYHGKSKMNFSGLVMHGLSAMSVFNEIVFVRLLIGALWIAGIAIGAMALVVTVRLFTEVAIPGWASYMLTMLAIIVMQALLLSLFAVFLALSNRANIPPSWADQQETLIADRSIVTHDGD